MEPHSVLFWVVALASAATVGLSKGGLPLVSMLSVPTLSLFMPATTAAGLLLPVFVISDWFGLYAYRRNFSLRLLLILAPAATVGVTLGWATASLIPESLVNGLVGLIGFLFSLNLLLRKPASDAPKEARILPGAFWGTAAGFTSFVSHSGGPPFQIYVLPLKLEKTVFAGTSTILFAYVNAIKLIPYYALGQLSLQSFEIAVYLVVPAVLAVFAGVYLVRILPQRIFFLAVTWALLIVSAKLIWDVGMKWLA